MGGFEEAASYALKYPERSRLVVALHGLTSTFRQPLGLLEGFDSTDFGVLAPDLRAHGETRFDGEPGDFTPDRLAQDVKDLLAKLDLSSRRITVLGISLGATVGLELLRGSGLDIDRAVFVRPAHDAGPPAHLSVNILIARLLQDDPSTALKRLLRTDEYMKIAAISPSAAEGLRAKITKRRSAERAMRLECGSVWRAFEIQETVDLSIPCLIVAAPQDPLHPLGVAQSWHRRIAGSTLACLPPRDTDPGGYSRASRQLVQRFLMSIPPQTRIGA